MRRNDYGNCDLIGTLNPFIYRLNYNFNRKVKNNSTNYFYSLRKHFGECHLQTLRKIVQWIKNYFSSPHSKQFYISLPNPNPPNIKFPLMFHLLAGFSGIPP